MERQKHDKKDEKIIEETQKNRERFACGAAFLGRKPLVKKITRHRFLLFHWGDDGWPFDKLSDGGQYDAG